MILTDLIPSLGSSSGDDNHHPENGGALSTEVLFNENSESRQIVDPSQNEEEVSGLVQGGKASFLGSILRLVENASAPVPAKTIIRGCSLVISPGNVPGHLDAKEFILAALQFLSSEVEGRFNLPFISAAHHQDDAEKRAYQKTGSWSLSDPEDLERINQLDTIFLESPLPPLGRARFCPFLAPGEEGPLLMKGTIPSSATAKKKGAGAKRKSAASPAVSETADEVILPTY
eukprot:CAMPEP_0116828972 /NCGR_PEP_ID=MMETSP0418-20121206/3938_1 /TAXON_ID=1158023 /ORGANISM="Astrosyne radiata, Strain 13vi08-1A" /LENGTH=230 /DNA_ID=CAMNT_0004457891 /DNA_START=88 /DNA_END=780 /DNA_ORIENTATION=-